MVEKDDQIENDFMYHPTSPDQLLKYQAIREKAKEFAYLMVSVCPTDSSEFTEAYANLRLTVMWANASIACN